MPGYDAKRFDPPAPWAAVELRAQGKTLSGMEMLIDSGSDVTLLPASFVNALGLPVGGQRRYEVIAFDGSRSISVSVQCEVVFLGVVYRGAYLVVEAEYGILGRDILNHLSLVLDGPRLQWREEHASD